VPLTVGFFRLANAGRDKAFLDSVAGACVFRAGDRSGANQKFREAVREDPSCLNCKYLLAVSEASLGRGRAAADMIKEIDISSRGALTPEDRALIRDLAGAGTREALNMNPYFFLDEVLAAAAPRQERDKGAPKTRRN
jgi:hypothetical protein